MEALCALGCAGLMWMAAFMLLPADAPLASMHRAHHLIWHLKHGAMRTISALSSTGIVTWLIAHDSVRALCDETTDVAVRHGYHSFTRERSCAALILGVGLASLLCACAARSFVGLTPVPVACAVGLSLWNASRRRQAAQELSSAMPGVFRALAMALGAGETLSQAIEYVGAHEQGRAGKAFMRAALRLRCGSSVEEALRALSHELEAPSVGLLVTALLISQRTGSPLHGLFEHSATLVERAREFERMLAVKTAQVRLSVRIVCLLPVVMLAGLSLISRDFQHGLLTPPGMASVAVAALMDLTALAIIRRIMRGVL